MPTYLGQREQDLARRVRRMLIEQSAVLQDETPDEFSWLSKHFPEEQRFFEDELGAHLELRLGRWARAYWPAPPRQREFCISDIFELTARKQTAYAGLDRSLSQRASFGSWRIGQHLSLRRALPLCSGRGSAPISLAEL